MTDRPEIKGLAEAMAKVGDRALIRMDVIVDRLTRDDAEALLEFAIQEQGDAYGGPTQKFPRRLENAEGLRDLGVAAILVLSGRWPRMWLEPATE